MIKAVRGAQRVAGIDQRVHILRHTFCSHLAMKGAPARAIPELAGHADLTTTQRSRHLSLAAAEDAIRLLDGRQSGLESPADFETFWRRGRLKLEITEKEEVNGAGYGDRTRLTRVF